MSGGVLLGNDFDQLLFDRQRDELAAMALAGLISFQQYSAVVTELKHAYDRRPGYLADVLDERIVQRRRQRNAAAGDSR